MLAPMTMLALRAHAAQEYTRRLNGKPRECCGVVIQTSAGIEKYIACRNIATGASEFEIHPQDYAAAEDVGKIVAICHSHPDVPPTPSPADRAMCSRGTLPWVIVSHPSGQTAILQPEARAGGALLGRMFCYGLYDCYTLVRDYYAQQLNIALPDFLRSADARTDVARGWIEANVANAGFIEIDKHEARPHDVILLKMLHGTHADHLGVLDAKNNLLHHLYNALSRSDAYGNYYKLRTFKVVRHQSLVKR